MTKEEVIEILKSVRVWTTRDEVEKAIDTAIDTMRKYQKIEDIIANWKIYGDVDSYDCIADIYEVLESEE